jgi:hypothetical protein
MPLRVPPPYEPAPRAAKTIKMTVERRREFDRDHLSLVYPNTSWPRTVPAKVTEETFFCEGDPVYFSPYSLVRMVETDPMT